MVHELAGGAAGLPGKDPDTASREGGAALLKDKASSMLLYVMPDDHHRLRQLALDRGVSVQTLVMDGIDMLLAGEGQGPLERWETRRRRRRG